MFIAPSRKGLNRAESSALTLVQFCRAAARGTRPIIIPRAEGISLGGKAFPMLRCIDRAYLLSGFLKSTFQVDQHGFELTPTRK